MDRMKRWTMIAVVLGSGIVFLDSTVVNVALPRISEDLPTRFFGVLEGQSYVYYGYLLTLSALLILAGALSDRYGRRRMFAVGLAGFGATSLLCGLAASVELLVLFRVLQGAAGALLVPGSLSIITAAFSGEEQGRAFGIWASASGATTIAGPFLGGMLVDSITWRAAFLINVPLVALAVYATLRFVPESRDEQARGGLDWAGALAATLAVGGLAFGAIRGQEKEWQDVAAFVALAVGALATAAFPFLMARSPNPLVPIDLFRIRNFAIVNISTFLIYGALYVAFYYVVIFVQGTLGYNAAAAGLSAAPATILLVLFSSRFGALATKRGPRLFLSLGPGLMAVGILWMVGVDTSSDPWVLIAGDPSSYVPPTAYLTDFLPAWGLFGAGLMMMVAPLTSCLMTSIPSQKAGVGSAINNAISRVGPQLAGALIFVAITASFYSGLERRVPELDVSSREVRSALSPLNRPGDSVPAPAAAAAREASTHSFHLAMVFAAGLLIAGGAVNLLGIRNPSIEPSKPKPVVGGVGPESCITEEKVAEAPV